MFSWAQTIRPPKPGNILPGPLQENSTHPAPDPCCSKPGLWTSILGLPQEAIRTRNFVSNPDPLTQNLRIPGDSCSQYSQRSTGLEALLHHSVVAPSPGAGREDQGVWPPGAPPPPGRALSTWTPKSLLPEPMPASLPGPMSQPDRRSRFRSLSGGRGWFELGLKGWGCSFWAADCSGHKEGQSQSWEEQGEGLGLGRPLPLLSCLLAWSSVSKTPVCQVLIVMNV